MTTTPDPRDAVVEAAMAFNVAQDSVFLGDELEAAWKRVQRALALLPKPEPEKPRFERLKAERNGSDGGRIILQESGMPVAFIGDDLEFDEVMPYARLFAAAPDLLAAAEGVLQTTPYLESNAGALTKLRNAVQRAKGG